MADDPLAPPAVAEAPLEPKRPADAATARLVVEALLFQAEAPLEAKDIQSHVGPAHAVEPLLLELQASYAERGIRLERHGSAWAFRTAAELAPYMQLSRERPKRLSRAALETLAIIAYQQPVTRAEIEAVRAVPVSSGTLDLLVDAGWVTPRGRKDAPGRPVMWGTTSAFLDHFDLASLGDLPRLDELEGAGLFRPLRQADGPAEPPDGPEDAPDEAPDATSDDASDGGADAGRDA